MEEVRWRSWLLGLPPMAPGERLVVEHLVRLADWRGMCVVSTEHLVQHTGCARRTVFRCLKHLEDQGIIRREKRRHGSRQAPSRIQLIEQVTQATPAPAMEGDGLTEAGLADPAHDLARYRDNAGLRSLILDAHAEGWEGPASRSLAALLLSEAPVQFAAPIKRAMWMTGVSHADAKAEIVSRAWETVVASWERIVDARRPWAMLTVMLGRIQFELRTFDDPATATDPTTLPDLEAHAVSDAVLRAQGWGIEDFGAKLTGVIDALCAAGMDETLAWVGTYRLMMIVQSVDASRQRKTAENDLRLAELQIPPQAAREWMNLLLGSPRKKIQPAVALGREELEQRASQVVALCSAPCLAA